MRQERLSWVPLSPFNQEAIFSPCPLLLCCIPGLSDLNAGRLVILESEAGGGIDQQGPWGSFPWEINVPHLVGVWVHGCKHSSTLMDQYTEDLCLTLT